MNKKTLPKVPNQKAKPRRTQRDESRGLVISSWSGLEEYLRARPAAIENITYAPREERRLKELLARIGGELDIPASADDQYQEGLTAKIRLDYCEEEPFFASVQERQHDLIIACDHITDTRNLGAIARTAAFFGCLNILLPKDRQAPITNATLGAAQGAFAQLEPVIVTNLARTLLRLKECGYWILCADMEGSTLDDMPQIYEKVVLVLGSEERGVGVNVLNKCDLKIAIPSPGRNLESLNVSVAAGILIHALHQRYTATQKTFEG